MKVKIPDELKADMPQTPWGKILSATPVIMAVVATLLAGLASSEMTRAQYDRSLAAQEQSKAGDQWSFFQAKRLRGAFQHNTLDLLESIAEVHPLEAEALRQAAAQLPAGAAALKASLSGLLDSAAGQKTLAALQAAQLPSLGAGPALDPRLKAALEALESSRPESQIAPLVAQVNDRTIEESLRSAKDRALAFAEAVQPVSQMIDLLEKLFAQRAASSGFASGTGPSLGRDFTAARLRFTALRYEAEARLNQAIANFYELQVRRGNLSAEHHHARSQRFFYGMLAAQMAVIVSTLAIATRRRNLLWSLAAAAGVAAIAFAIYVYLYV